MLHIIHINTFENIIFKSEKVNLALVQVGTISVVLFVLSVAINRRRVESFSCLNLYVLLNYLMAVFLFYSSLPLITVVFYPTAYLEHYVRERWEIMWLSLGCC